MYSKDPSLRSLFHAWQNVAFGSFFGFTLVQLVFAYAARSQAMMADCAAMAVDAITYLFNFFAEKTKHREITEEEKLLDPDVLQSRLKLIRLYLELIPPLISVTTLLVVTIVSLKQAIEVLLENEPVDNPPDVILMLIFSGLNLLLDAVNVRCFASAEDHFVGIPSAFHHHGDHKEETQTELTGLLGKRNNDGNRSTYAGLPHGEATLRASEHDDIDDERSSSSQSLNLNMCSAWTVSNDSLFICNCWSY
jgi:Co/Zn/Cd efflux system component